MIEPINTFGLCSFVSLSYLVNY